MVSKHSLSTAGSLGNIRNHGAEPKKELSKGLRILNLGEQCITQHTRYDKKLENKVRVFTYISPDTTRTFKKHCVYMGQVQIQRTTWFLGFQGSKLCHPSDLHSKCLFTNCIISPAHNHWRPKEFQSFNNLNIQSFTQF